MSEDGGPPQKRAKILKDDYKKLSKDELIQRLSEQDFYIDSLLAKADGGPTVDGGATGPKADVEEKLKQQQVEASRRENVLVMRLTTKEQEMQEYLNQIQELKQTKNQATAHLRAMLLDPAMNLMFQRMKKEMDSCKEKLEQAQNDLAAWKFTPDSQTGKRLMAKCKMLLQENEELGRTISSGRTAQLEGEIALEKKFVEEMKLSQAETDEFLGDMDEDLEGMQSTIYFLQQQLREAKEDVSRLQQDNQQLQGALQSQPSPQTDTTPTTDHNSEKDTAQLLPVAGEFTEGATEQRTLNFSDPAPHTPHVPPGNNSTSPINTRTNAIVAPECHGEGVVSSSSVEHRTQYDGVPPPSLGSTNIHPKAPSQTPQQVFYTDTGDGNRSPTRGHVAMETDQSEEPQSSCEDEQQVAAVETGDTVDQRNCCSPQQTEAVSPEPPQAPPSAAFNHATNRTPQSSDGAFTFEATDSDDWSPSNQSKTSGMVSDEEQKGALGEKYRTESKKAPADVVQNGLPLESREEETPAQ